MGTSAENNENAPIAFVLVVFAGLSTCIGAGFVFNTRLVKLASKRFLAGSLGLSGGVMLYLSLVEILGKSQGAFVAHGHSEADSYTFATVSLFGGILFYKGIDYVVHLLEGDVGDHKVDIHLYDLSGSSSGNPPHGNASTTKGDAFTEGGTVAVDPSGVADLAVSAADKPLAQTGKNGGGNGQQQAHHAHHRPRSSREFPDDHDIVVELSTGPIIRPSPDLHTLQLNLAGKVQQQQHAETPVSALSPEGKVDAGEDFNVVEEGAGTKGAVKATMPAGQSIEEGDDRKLVRMGFMTAVAIGIHNFPEGLATFVATLSDPAVGAALAVAIAIHNIPEGLCVAIPVYYATGNRCKAFGWALLSGVSEPIGAGLGWLILKDVMNDLVYGILFGLVAGLMVNITIHELIPTAVRYDPADKVTTSSIFAGMAVMALSLTLFKY